MPQSNQAEEPAISVPPLHHFFFAVAFFFAAAFFFAGAFFLAVFLTVSAFELLRRSAAWARFARSCS